MSQYLLDGKPVLTPSRRALAAPSRALAQAIAAEWDAQTELIDPARMPLTRLANAVIDAVSETPQPVADEVAKYLGTDLLFYRAEAPAGLIEKQAQAWDPVLAWARERLRRAFRAGARRHARAATTRSQYSRSRAAIPDEPWRLACGVIDHDVDRLRPAGARARAAAHSTPMRLGRPRMSTRTGRCRNGAEMSSRWNAAHFVLPNFRRQWRCYAVAYARPMRPR